VWMHSWAQREFRLKKSKAAALVKNHLMWKRMFEIKTHLVSQGWEIKAQWCKGHNGNLYNEQCDYLATQAIGKNKRRFQIERTKHNFGGTTSR
jgi:ribonuclease HI